MITISPTNFQYLLDGNTVGIKTTSGEIVNIKLDASLVKSKNHVKKPLPESLITRAGIITQ